VSWEQAAAYCEWRDERLPTEAEWEMAAGWNSAIGAKSLWPWGNSAELATANVGGNAADMPTAVGAHPDDTAASGLLDMGGNVREWVHDWYKVNYYGSAENSNPRGPTNRRGEGTGRVVRGGSFADAIEYARTANRGHDDPAYSRAMTGFRCAQDQ
jgi:formylglycine-generating enzyme required for sulfatase activity